MTENRTIALLGQPNSGKSSIFNSLTGMHQHVGNWPGKTVEKKEGTFVHNDVTYTIADLPGSYALSANSDEEIVTRDYIVKEDVDMVCILADASQLERSLYMLADFAGLKTPAMLVLTMGDVAKVKGKVVDTKALSAKLGIEVCEVIAFDKKTFEPFYAAVENTIKNGSCLQADALYSYFTSSDIASEYAAALAMAEKMEDGRYTKEWIAAKILEEDELIVRRVKIKELGDIPSSEKTTLAVSDARFTWIGKLLEGCVENEKKPSELLTKFDKRAIAPGSGTAISIVMMIVALLGSMLVAIPFMGLGGATPSILNPVVDAICNGLGVSAEIAHFIKATLVTSLGWVISMVGFIFGMSFVFGILEEVGYMARVSYVFDRSMSKIGLQGKAIMPMIMGFGCTMGSTAGSKVIDSYGQRILTIAVAWAIPCGATFVVIPTLANAFFGGGGGMLVMLFIFLIMFLHVLVTAKIFGRKLNPVENRTGIIMELPPYHKPRWGFIFKNSLMRMWDVFKKAFSIEVIVCIIFFFLSYSSAGIESSILYKIGTAIEPVSRFFGMGWETFMSFFAAMISKEAVLGVLSAIFANSGSIVDSTTGLAATSDNVAQIVAASISKAEALAFIIAVTFNIPCLQAVVSTYNETHSAKWTAKIGGYYILTALILSAVVYHVAALFM
ncbi:MAG: ferrous iron transport protein B [Lachnospiraceae bacterium]|nr:ferrous iron transport protein B [Lachnospiraceae bacterium]